MLSDLSEPSNLSVFRFICGQVSLGFQVNLYSVSSVIRPICGFRSTCVQVHLSSGHLLLSVLSVCSGFSESVLWSICAFCSICVPVHLCSVQSLHSGLPVFQ